MTFVPHPLLKVHAVFYLKLRHEVVFVKEMVGPRGKFNTRDGLDLQQLDDAGLMALIGLFGRKEPLSRIYRRTPVEAVPGLGGVNGVFCDHRHAGHDDPVYPLRRRSKSWSTCVSTCRTSRNEVRWDEFIQRTQPSLVGAAGKAAGRAAPLDSDRL